MIIRKIHKKHEYLSLKYQYIIFSIETFLRLEVESVIFSQTTFNLLHFGVIFYILCGKIGCKMFVKKLMCQFLFMKGNSKWSKEEDNSRRIGF